MPDYIRDIDLNRLVQELNEQVSPPPDEAEASETTSTVNEAHPLAALLQEMVSRRASDMLLVEGLPPTLRASGGLTRLDKPTLSASAIENLLAMYLTPRVRDQLRESGSADFSLGTTSEFDAGSSTRSRFRLNVHRQKGSLAASIRALPHSIPSLADLNLPPLLAELTTVNRGLVLVCGPTGSGKTSTLAAMVNHINRTSSRHIIAIEDPIEYEHDSHSSVVEQIEIGRDAPSFASALRAALRQDPDVILLGEMRDHETVSTALTAAETGHLILSTLHTSDVSQSIHRIVDVFPSSQQSQIFRQIALTLHAVICQQLVPRISGEGRLPALEILVANYAIRNHIRNEKMQNIYSEITLGKRQGMITLEESLAALVRSGAIAEEEARWRAARSEELDSALRGFSTNRS